MHNKGGGQLELNLSCPTNVEYFSLYPTMEWDTAAGQAICEHADFQVLDWSSKICFIIEMSC